MATLTREQEILRRGTRALWSVADTCTQTGDHPNAALYLALALALDRHAEQGGTGEVRLELPNGWKAELLRESGRQVARLVPAGKPSVPQEPEW